MASVTRKLLVAPRPRAFVRVAGPDAEDYLQRMLSNDVAALEPGGSCEALLLTPKARLIALVVVLRRGADDFLLLTEPELGEQVRAHLVRMRLRARCEVETESHRSTLVLGEEGPVLNRDYGIPARELLDEPPPADVDEVSADQLEVMRIEAGTPRHGRELDDRVLPAEAGLVERAVSFTKGCYPGQEPIARLHYRGHSNRGLRVLEIASEQPPPYDAELVHEGKAVGRVTSVAQRPDGTIVALGYVRTDVPADAELAVASGGTARGYTVPPARPELRG
jgi:tRNA-modifying protein YgfZ